MQADLQVPQVTYRQINQVCSHMAANQAEVAVTQLPPATGSMETTFRRSSSSCGSSGNSWWYPISNTSLLTTIKDPFYRLLMPSFLSSADSSPCQCRCLRHTTLQTGAGGWATLPASLKLANTSPLHRSSPVRRTAMRCHSRRRMAGGSPNMAKCGRRWHSGGFTRGFTSSAAMAMKRRRRWSREADCQWNRSTWPVSRRSMKCSKSEERTVNVSLLIWCSWTHDKWCGIWLLWW